MLWVEEEGCPNGVVRELDRGRLKALTDGLVEGKGGRVRAVLGEGRTVLSPSPRSDVVSSERAVRRVAIEVVDMRLVRRRERRISRSSAP